MILVNYDLIVGAKTMKKESTQTRNGKSFEYALIKALYEKLSLVGKVIIKKNSSYSKANKFYEDCTKNDQNDFDSSAKKACEWLIKKNQCYQKLIRSRKVIYWS